MIASTPSSQWIRRFHPAEDSKVRLVCLPHAGGSAPFYFPMSQVLSPGVDVISVQYPGRQDRRTEPCITDINILADRIRAELDPWLDRPVAFFGHSMGAVLAFEVVRRLERDGRSVLRVFASGRRAPSTHRDESVHRRDDDGVVAEMRELSGTDARVLANEELLRMAMPAIRGDYTAIETYRAEPDAVVSAPITALTGDADPRTSSAEINAWRAHTTGQFELFTYAGGHFFLANHQAEINKLIADRLSVQPMLNV